jgi:uncharacterized OsmC-like protein
VDASGGKLVGEAAGEIELDGKVLVIRRIHVHYKLTAGGVDPEIVERAHSLHAERCPVARSIRDAIDISTSYELV